MSFSDRVQALHDYLSTHYLEFDPTHERLNSLYSDFSKLKVFNSYGYQTNLSCWRTILLDCHLHGYLKTGDHACLINPQDLPDLFCLPTLGKPLCLDQVMDAMRPHELMTLSAFKRKYPLPSDPSSGWMARWFRETDAWIVMPTMAHYARTLLDQLRQVRLSSLDECHSRFRSLPYSQESPIELSKLDIELLLRYLVCQYGVAVEQTGEQIVIKATESEKAVISKEDRAIVSFKSACTTLEDQINRLEQSSQEFLSLARQDVKHNRKPQALYRLRKRKEIERLLRERYGVLNTMETVLLQIEAAQHDLQVIQAFNVGTDTLRSLLTQPSLVEDTMDRLKETLEGQREIEEAMHGPLDAELEQQLSALTLKVPSIDTQSELKRLERVFSTLNPS